jgi:hypothetical protein
MRLYVQVPPTCHPRAALWHESQRPPGEQESGPAQGAEPKRYPHCVDFAEALARQGFEAEIESPRGVRVYNAHPNRFLTYTVQTFEDGGALFTFEFALGEYLATKGIQVGSDEALNQFAYPRQDIRGAQDAAWLASAIEQAEGLLADVRLDRPDG